MIYNLQLIICKDLAKSVTSCSEYAQPLCFLALHANFPFSFYNDTAPFLFPFTMTQHHFAIPFCPTQQLEVSTQTKVSEY